MSNSTPKSIDTPTEAPFTFTLRSLMDANDTPEGARYATTTQVRSAASQAVMAINAFSAGSGRPIGLFAVRLAPEQLRRVSDAAEGIVWNSLPPLTGGDITGATLTFEYERGSKLIQRTCNSWNRTFLEALSPLTKAVDELTQALLSSPERALGLEVRRSERGLSLVVHNPGRGPVVLRDPRTLDPAGKSTLGFVRVSEVLPTAQQGYGLERTYVFKLTSASVDLAPVVLPAGAKMEFEVEPWVNPPPGPYAAIAFWTDYQGPRLSANSVLARLPSADALKEPLPYEIRGETWSLPVSFTVEPPASAQGR